MKKIYYGNEARSILMKGVNTLANAVKTSLGPKGRNSVIHRGYGLPVVTKDGVTIAKEVQCEDPGEQMGVELVRQAALKTNETVGDGTTTSTVLAQELIKLALAAIDNDPSIDVHKMRADIEERVEQVCARLDEQAVPVAGDVERLKQVATISANNDAKMGEVIATLLHELGVDGVVTVDDGQEIGMKVERVEGLRFMRGMVSPYMMNDAERQMATMVDPVVMVTDYRVTTAQELLAIIKPLVDSGRKEIFIMAEALEGDALSIVSMNGPMFKNNFHVVATTPPGYGDRKKEMMQDICAITGATLISLETGRKLDSFSPADCGSAKKITSNFDMTTIVEGSGAKEAIDARVASVKAQLARTDLSVYDREKLEERLAKLQGGVAVIKIGATTEGEAKEKKYLIEDAVNAVKAAMKEGIVAGGGCGLMMGSATLVKSEKIGINIVDGVSTRPFYQILVNAGLSEDSIKKIVIESDTIRYNDVAVSGYDAKNGRIVTDMLAAGIIDPVSVTKSALRNAASVAGTILTTETLIVDVPDTKI